MKKTFYISDRQDLSNYEKENKRVSYKRVIDRYIDDMILCNEISKRYEYLELYNGEEFDENGDYIEIYQYYIIDGNIDGLIKALNDSIIYYDNELDIYILGVTHYGTSWDYVLTDLIPTTNINSDC